MRKLENFKRRLIKVVYQQRKQEKHFGMEWGNGKRRKIQMEHRESVGIYVIGTKYGGRLGNQKDDKELKRSVEKTELTEKTICNAEETQGKRGI